MYQLEREARFGMFGCMITHIVTVVVGTELDIYSTTTFTQAQDSDRLF